MAIRSFLIAVVIIFAITPVAAQSSVGFGPQVGFFRAQSADKARAMGGLALRVNISEAVGIEGSINYREEIYNKGSVVVNSWPVMVTGLLYPVPFFYGAFGAGWYNTSISYNVPSGIPGGFTGSSRETKQQFGWHFGGGLDLPVSSVARVVTDLKYAFVNYNFKNVSGADGMNNNFFVVTVGILFTL